MSLETLSNINEKVEITPSALNDIKAFSDFIKNSEIEKLPDNKVSKYIYVYFCTNPEINEESVSNKTRRKFINSRRSVEKALNNTIGVEINEEDKPWLGYKINGGCNEKGSLRRMYINTKVEHTPGFFKDVVENMQKSGLHCNAKTFVGDVKNDFSRVDKMVIYFNESETMRVYDTLHELYVNNDEIFNTKVPRFTQHFKDMPGIGFGEEPVTPDKSFSDVRSEILARVYFNYRQSGYDEGFDFVSVFQEACKSFQVDSKNPSRNLEYLKN